MYVKRDVGGDVPTYACFFEKSDFIGIRGDGIYCLNKAPTSPRNVGH